MKSLVLAGLISLAMLPLAPCQTAVPETTNPLSRKSGSVIERYRAALTQRDSAALGRIWADDYTFINGSGALLTKAQRLANLKSGSTALDSINEEEDIKVRVYGGDTAVAISRVTIKGQYSGQQATGEYRSSHIWTKTSSGWQLVCNQLTPIAKR